GHQLNQFDIIIDQQHLALAAFEGIGGNTVVLHELIKRFARDAAKPGARDPKSLELPIVETTDNGQLKGFRVPGSRFRRIPREALYKFMKDNGIPTDALESGKRKVLLVDDDVELVELMTKVLEEDGRFEVRVATTGFDAGMMVKEYRP